MEEGGLIKYMRVKQPSMRFSYRSGGHGCSGLTSPGERVRVLDCS